MKSTKPSLLIFVHRIQWYTRCFIIKFLLHFGQEWIILDLSTHGHIMQKSEIKTNSLQSENVPLAFIKIINNYPRNCTALTCPSPDSLVTSSSRRT